MCTICMTFFLQVRYFSSALWMTVNFFANLWLCASTYFLGTIILYACSNVFYKITHPSQNSSGPPHSESPRSESLLIVRLNGCSVFMTQVTLQMWQATLSAQDAIVLFSSEHQPYVSLIHWQLADMLVLWLQRVRFFSYVRWKFTHEVTQHTGNTLLL